jgi:hypothetical protein
LYRQRHIHVRLYDLTFPLSAGNSEQFFPFFIPAHGQTGGKIEVIHIQKNGSILPDIHQMVQNFSSV